MTNQEQLEADFKMFEEAIRELQQNGSDPEVIRQLEQKKSTTAQVLNLTPKSLTKKKPYFF